MKPRVIVVIVAAVVALLGVGAVVVYAQGANSRAIAASRPVQVYISSQVVPAGTSLKTAVAQGLVSRTNLPADATPSGALKEVTAANQNLVAVTDIQQGEYILSSRFAAAAVGTQAISVPSGMVAVSASLSDPARVGAFMTPGSRIVIYDTHDTAATSSNPGGGKVTQVLLQDVLVIAVGDRSLSPSDSGATVDTKDSSVLATVALSPSDATRLVHAIQTGELYAALQGADTKVTEGGTVKDSTLFPTP